MTAEVLLEKIKNNMRIRHTALDAAITDDMYAGALELERAGVSAYKVVNDQKEFSDDQLVITAIRYFVQSAENYNDKGTQYQQSFEKLRDAMALSGDYKKCVTNG